MGIFVLRNGDACRETWWFLRCSLLPCFFWSCKLQSMAIPGSDWLEVPTCTYHILLAHFLGLNFREYPQKIWPNIWYVNRTSMYWILENSHRSGWISYHRETGKQAIGWPTIEKFPLSCECRRKVTYSEFLAKIVPVGACFSMNMAPLWTMKDKIDYGHEDIYRRCNH